MIWLWGFECGFGRLFHGMRFFRQRRRLLNSDRVFVDNALVATTTTVRGSWCYRLGMYGCGGSITCCSRWATVVARGRPGGDSTAASGCQKRPSGCRWLWLILLK
ncbi:hypothetical protein Dimus_033169 [Dionaea muscipula]